ncbi:MAG: S8 family serine peptidase [Flavobacteriales bacterium]|nr:S8 family serine peptidase [Flavobacteriales bacterium]
MKKNLIIILLFLVSIGGYAQEDALVFFTDKENVDASIANPITILTQEAIDRKQLHNVPIDERDVPVTESYITQLKNTAGITVHAKSKWMNAAYVRGSLSNIQDLTNLTFVAGVEFLDKSLNFSAPAQTTTSKFEQESRIDYNYGDATNQTEMIAVDFLHELDFTGEDMVVAFMDSGFPNIDTNPAFSEMISEGRLLGTYDFAERQIDVDGTGSHGSLTLSNAAGLLNGSFVGTAPEASYYLFRTEFAPSENPVEEAWWVEALERSDSLGVDVVNTSLGYQDYDDEDYTHSYSDLDGQTTIAARGANHAFDKGMLLVTSAGNDGDNSFVFAGTPGDAPGILTIGAVDSQEDYAFFSSIGPTVDGRVKPDVMAQGLGAAVVDQNGNVTSANGTSFSSPIMAGAVASLWQSRPETPNYQLMQIIRESAHLFENPTDQMGYGIPNFEAAYNALTLLGVEEQLKAQQFAIYPNPIKDKINVSFPQGAEEAVFTLYNVLGELLVRKAITNVKNTINVSELSTGVYIANIRSNNQTTSYKLIKEY